ADRPAHRAARYRHRGDARGGPGGRRDGPRPPGRRRVQRDQHEPVQRQPGLAVHLHLRAGVLGLEVRSAPRLDRRADPGRARTRAHRRGEAARHAQQVEGMTTMAKRVEAVGATAYYGALKAIDGISMVIEPKAAPALIGPW